VVISAEGEAPPIRIEVEGTGSELATGEVRVFFP
jgi:hypothetical protein